jgi:hypothetical protein
MGSCSSTPQVQPQAIANEQHPLVASGEFIERRGDLIPTIPHAFICEVECNIVDLSPTKYQLCFSCILTDPMRAEIQRIQTLYSSLTIIKGWQLFVPRDVQLPPLEAKVRVTLCLIKHPNYKNTLITAWHLVTTV